MTDDEYCDDVQSKVILHYANCGFTDLGFAFEDMRNMIEKVEFLE